MLADATLASYDVVMFALRAATAVDGRTAGGAGELRRRGAWIHRNPRATDTPMTGLNTVGSGAYSEHPGRSRRTSSWKPRRILPPRLGSRFSIREEFYTSSKIREGAFRCCCGSMQRRLGQSAISAGMGTSIGAGRVYYNALGHFSETWANQRFVQQLLRAIRWAAGR